MRILATFTLCLLFTAAACDNDSSSNDTRKISSLTAEEILDLCQQSDEMSPKATTGARRMSCIFQLSFGGQCTSEGLDQCMAQPSTPSSSCELPSETEMADYAKCDATVAEMFACIDAVEAELEQLSTATCETSLEPIEPAACKSLATKCPDAFGND